MHSSWKIWDLFESKKSLLTDSTKFYCFQSFDPYVFKIIKDNLVQNHFNTETVKVMIGRDITISWLEDNFMSLGLFGNTDSYIILMAEEMKKECKDFLIKNIENLILDNCYLILDFQKDDSFLKKVSLLDQVDFIKITPPAFWESEKILSFVCDYKQLYLTREAKEYLLKNVSPEISLYINLAEQIKLNVKQKTNVDVDDILKYVKFSKIDNFEFANAFGTKRFDDFYKQILNIEDYSSLRLIFSFMQSHIIKLIDPRYTEFKPKQTKYDRSIMEQAKLWNVQALNRSLNYFVEMENLAKSKDPFLRSKLQKDFMRIHYR